VAVRFPSNLSRAKRLLSRLTGGSVILLFGPNLAHGGNAMKGLAILGIVVLVIGIISFLVPFPHYHHHGVSLGDAHVGVTTEHDEKLPPLAGIVLVVVGAGLIIAGKN
jgi:hypothetical protein